MAKVSEKIVSKSPIFGTSCSSSLWSLWSLYTCFACSIDWEKHTTFHKTSWLITIWLCDSVHPRRADPHYLSPFSPCFLSRAVICLVLNLKHPDPVVTLQDCHTNKAIFLKTLLYNSSWWICTKQPWAGQTPKRGGRKFSVRLRTVCPLKAGMSSLIHKVPLFVQDFITTYQKPHLSPLKVKDQLITQVGPGVAPTWLDWKLASTPSSVCECVWVCVFVRVS